MGYYGFDTSWSPGYGGYPSAASIKSYFASSGYTPTFWGRYWDPTPSDVAAIDFSWSRSATELASMSAAGIYRLAVLTSPAQSRISSGRASYGKADGNTVCSAIDRSYHNINQLFAPTSGQIYIFLDVEYGTALSSGYWNAWADAVDAYTATYIGGKPFYPCAYIDPSDPKPNCSTMAATDKGFAIWSSSPRPVCSGCSFQNRSWVPSHCATQPSYTALWQSGEPTGPPYPECQGCRSGYPNVDIDQGNPSRDPRVYMMRNTLN